MFMENNNRGFTLIELLVVICIIGILSAVGVVAYNGYTSSAKINATKTIHAQTVKYISAELQKCSSGEETVLENLSCSGIHAKKIVSHIGSNGKIFSDRNSFTYDTYAVQTGDGFQLGEVRLKSLKSKIIVNSCMNYDCSSSDIISDTISLEEILALKR